MKETLASVLKYPVYVEGRDTPISKWELIYEAKDAIDFEFAMTRYKLPVLPLMRARDSSGEIFDVSQEQLLKFHEIATKENLARLKPLLAFSDAAPEQAMESAIELARGGLVSKHFTISPNSQVQLGHPNLDNIRFTELEDSVVCRIFTHSGTPTETEPSVIFWKEKANFSVIPEELDLQIKGFLCLLSAAILRDFWVLENRSRQRAYQTRTEKERKREGKGKDRKRTVLKTYTFIPRFQYDLSTYDGSKKVSREVRVTLSPHLVSGHFRKLPGDWKASDTAKDAAAEFGLTLTDGYTFVRPHERGEIEQMRTYRSRSAFELIFGESI